MMEENNEIFIRQVQDYLEVNQLRDPDPRQIFQKFAGQADQYQISEQRFYAEILREAFRRATFADIPEQDDDLPAGQKPVLLFGEQIKSLKKLGKVLFDHPDKSKGYLEDMTLLKQHTDQLDSADAALAYANVYRSEQNFEKRYLKIIYKLNPALPYRFGGRQYATLAELFERSFKESALYEQLYNDFAAGKLALWLSESQPDQAAKLSGAKSYNAFLRFMYEVNSGYPFFLNKSFYANPQQIAEKAMLDLEFRKDVFKGLDAEQLFTWFDCIGNSYWQSQYESELALLGKSNLEGDTLIHAAVQKLILIINPEIVKPSLELSVAALNYTEIEASKPLVLRITLNLLSPGFLLADVSADINTPGIDLSQSTLQFFDLDGSRQHDIYLLVNPILLSKDKLYSFTVHVKTDYTQYRIPVKIKSMFPMRTYRLMLAKYAGIGFVLMALFRYALQVLRNSSGWLYPELIVTDLDGALPLMYPSYIFLFLIFLGLVGISYRLIKKTEKL